MKRSVKFGIIFLFLCCISVVSNASSQLVISDSETYFEHQSSTIQTSVVKSTLKAINYTQAGQDIQDNPYGNSIVGVGKWQNKSADITSTLNSVVGLGRCMLIREYSSDYGLLWYNTTANESITFEIWIYTLNILREIKCMLSNDGNSTQIGFSFINGSIFTPNLSGVLENTSIPVKNAWTHFLVNWSSGGLHSLYINGIHRESKPACTQLGNKTMELGLKGGLFHFFYALGVSFSDEMGYIPFMAWNNSQLYHEINAYFPNIPQNNVQNISIEFNEQTNVSTLINTSIYDYRYNVSEYLGFHYGFVNATYNYTIPIFGRNYFNESSIITLIFNGFNLNNSFLWNLSYIRLRVDYFSPKVVILMDVDFDLTSIYMMGYIALCFLIFLYLIVYRQKDEPILIPFVLICAFPIFEAGFWELGVLFLCFFIYRCVIQIYRKIIGENIDSHVNLK